MALKVIQRGWLGLRATPLGIGMVCQLLTLEEEKLTDCEATRVAEEVVLPW